ncbi:MAG: polysaccharide deacetylase family protein [Clostridia bacterium]|nr:polysaccharide deacetylase family protein [Clostridia bacterium]
MPFYVIKSRTLAIILVVIISAILLTVSIDGVSAAGVYFGYANRKVPIYFVQTDEKQVAISFDAAWGADKTQGIVDILKEYNAGATFFLVGFWTDKYPDMVKMIDESGFEIGTHSNTHPDMAKLSSDQIKQELETSMKMITDITGKEVKVFRPPYGSYNNTLIDIAASLGLKTIQWDVDTLDWKGLSGQDICQRVLNSVKNGSIILCHNNSDHILEALPLILDRLQKQGYKITSVSDLIYADNYKIDRNGMQISLGSSQN